MYQVFIRFFLIRMLRKRLRHCVIIFRNILFFSVIILVVVIYKMKRVHVDHIKSKLSKNALKFIDFEEQYYENILEISKVVRLINKYNNEERILNLDIYGPVNPNSPVFVILTDKYKINLKYLVASLQHVVGVGDALIIFSHARYDENVNSLIKSIDFTRVLQIIYPFSIQVFPDVFPGFQKGDCTRDIGIDAAKYINCTGANTPDIHGRFRDPALAQRKHFWWWTANTVFENLSHVKNHKGIFIFLDDDVFLMEDFIHMTIQMKKTSQFVFQCDFVSLDSPADPDFFDTKTNGADIRTWDPKHHSSVLAFDLNIWNSIASHYYLFCNVDDYSWSRSLYYLSLNRKDGNRFKVISSTMPRAFKTSHRAGIYDQFLEYNIMDTVFQILEMQKRNQGNFFPTQLEVYLEIELDYDEFVLFDILDNNGGWSDPRDKKMCSNLTTNKIKKLILDMNSEFNQYKTEYDPNEDDD